MVGSVRQVAVYIRPFLGRVKDFGGRMCSGKQLSVLSKELCDLYF